MSTNHQLLLRQRARLYASIRSWMAVRKVLEVETPIISRFGNTDPAIESLSVDSRLERNIEPDKEPSARNWLRTSPEFFHKRLLAAGAGDLFEIGKVFRAEEVSSRHRVEFSMLEYYRLGFDEHALINDVLALMHQLQADFGQAPWPVKTMCFAQWFADELDIDIAQAPDSKLLACAQQFGAQSQLSRDACLDFLRAEVLETRLAKDTWCFVYDFPASQAALARLTPDSNWARRFELFGAGIELANGYFELTDPTMQRARFSEDLRRRAACGQRQIPMDQDLLAALERGLPDCAGVAIGLDRLLMVLIGTKNIQDVLAF